MKNLMAFFSLFLFFIFSVSAQGKIKWEPVKTPVKVEQIIGGKSLHNFWLVDDKKNFWHFVDGQWKNYSFKQLFPDVSFRFLHVMFLKPDKLFALLTDLDWHTHITMITKGKIIPFGDVAENPIYQIVSTSHTLYATGDFGLMLKLENGQWQKIHTPIHSHISFALPDKKGNIWLGTFNEGLYLYNGKTFKKIKSPPGEKRNSIVELKIIRDTLYVNTSRNISYKFYNKALHLISSGKSPFLNKIKLSRNGYYKIVTNNNKTRLIPFTYKIKSFKELDDGHALMLTQNNNLFYDCHVNKNFFINFAPIMGLDGPKYSFKPFFMEPWEAKNSLYGKLRPGIIFADFNNDHFQDILFFNISDERHPFLFLNNQNNYFNNFASLLDLNSFTYNGYFSYAFDLDGDNIPEIITSDFRNRKYYLNIIEKTAGKYHLANTIPIPEKYNISPVHAINFTDYDHDGDLDIILVPGYSKQGKGSILFFKNNGYGRFEQQDTAWTSLFKGWNMQAIFADFDGNGTDDIFISRNWGPNVLFFRNKKTGWTLHQITTPKNYRSQQRKLGALAFDYDNDGDLDIVCLAEKPFFRILQNDGTGYFTDVTKRLGLDTLRGKNSGQITAADFDNNGFIDLFVTVYKNKKWGNYLFLNDSARKFTDYSKKMGIANGNLEFAATADIDNDGDIDIYGYRDGNNILWLNNLDSNNFIELRLKGIKANSEAIGAKIWLYEAGHIGNRKFLAGYRQTGSNLTNRTYQNATIVHFGVQSTKHYDLKIVFPAGKTKIIKDVTPGKIIQVDEISPPVSWIYTTDNKAHILLRNKEFLSYLGTILIGLFFLMFAIYYGTTSLRWDVRLTTIIISLNLILFTILLIALYSATTSLKYYLPLGVIFLGSFGPVGFFLWIKKFTHLKSQTDKEYELFQALLNFSHGAWAASNMNSLQLFFENSSASDLNDPDFQKAFNKRKETFMHLTLPVIEKIISLAGEQENNSDLATDIQRYKTFIVRTIQSDITETEKIGKEKLVTAILKLRELLSKLKNRVFAHHSCYPSMIFNELKNELIPLMEENQVNLRIINRLPEDYPALTEPAALADILDNCIRNSLKAMSETKEKQLTIKLLKGDPRIFIEISDNGCGIPEENLEKIFENGFSTTHSTGYGLFQAREILSKYGGRIYVKSSVSFRKTTMVIELQKGSSK